MLQEAGRFDHSQPEARSQEDCLVEMGGFCCRIHW
jgi:hypothetical protein